MNWLWKNPRGKKYKEIKIQGLLTFGKFDEKEPGRLDIDLNFVCPLCKRALSLDKRGYICSNCNKVFPIVDDEIPCFIDLDSHKNEERQYERRSILSEKKKKFNFYLRSRPAEVLLEKGFKGKRGLDIGTGVGKNENFEHIYTKVTKNLVGVDVSLSAIRGLKSNFGNVIGVLADGCALPFESESFDFVSASGLVHHIVAKPGGLYNFLLEVYRVLRRGVFISNDPHLLYPASLIMYIPNRIVQKFKPGARGRVSYERPILFFEISKVMRQVGFEDIDFEGASFAHHLMSQWLIDKISLYEELMRKRGPYKYFAHWITVSGVK